MRVSYGTIKNTKRIDKPNEDVILCDCKNNFFILLDGVSRDTDYGKYPNPSPALDAANILKKEIYEQFILNYIDSKNMLNTILDAIKYANNKVQIYNHERNLGFAAGAVGIVVLLYENQLYYAYIGDCYGRLIFENKIVVFTSCQTELISLHKKEYSAYEIRENICNNPMHQYSYGVLNGDSRAIQFIHSGRLDLKEVKQVILTSDGMEPFLENCSSQVLQTKNAGDLLNIAQNEQYKNQDDRSIIKIEIESDLK